MKSRVGGQKARTFSTSDGPESGLEAQYLDDEPLAKLGILYVSPLEVTQHLAGEDPGGVV